MAPILPQTIRPPATPESRIEPPRPPPLTRSRLGTLSPQRELTHVAGLGDFTTVQSVQAALREFHLYGRFYQVSSLVEAMLRDTRIGGNSETRWGGLLSLPLTITPASEDKKDGEIAELLRARWNQMLPISELYQLFKWGHFTSVGLGQLIWRLEDGLWWPRLTTWRPRWIFWRDDTNTYWVNTRGGTMEIIPGNGQWVLHTPLGYESGRMDALVSSLAEEYCFRRWGKRDWARLSEVMGIPPRKAIVPMEATDEDKMQFVSEVAALGTESTIKIEQSNIPNGPKYDVEIGDTGAANSNGDSYDKMLRFSGEEVDFRMMGQTQAQGGNGGSLAKASVHYKVMGHIISRDGRTAEQTLFEQVITRWVELNFGDARRTPSINWDTKPPEDLTAKADTGVKVFTAIKGAADLGIPLDISQYLEQFGIQLRHDAPEEMKRKAGQIYAYHLEAGVVRVDEVRASLGLPPLGGEEGQKLVQAPQQAGAEAKSTAPEQPAPAPKPNKKPKKGKSKDTNEQLAALASALLAAAGGGADGVKGMVGSQQYVDQLTAASIELAREAYREDLAELRKAIREASSYDEARKNLLAAYKKMDPEKLAGLLHRAMLMANFSGRHGVLVDL